MNEQNNGSPDESVDYQQAGSISPDFSPPLGASLFIVEEEQGAENQQNFELLLKSIQELRYDFETKIKYDQSKERMVENLHRELQLHREGLYVRILRPVFMDLISIYDDVSKSIDDLHRTVGSQESNTIERYLLLFRDMLEELFFRNSVMLFKNENDTFVSNRQRITKTINTSESTQNKHVARRVAPGFEYEGMLLRPELIEIYKYVPVGSSSEV